MRLGLFTVTVAANSMRKSSTLPPGLGGVRLVMRKPETCEDGSLGVRKTPAVTPAQRAMRTQQQHRHRCTAKERDLGILLTSSSSARTCEKPGGSSSRPKSFRVFWRVQPGDAE